MRLVPVLDLTTHQLGRGPVAVGRLIVGVPYLAISSSNSVVRLAVVLSESISTASRVVSLALTPTFSRKTRRQDVSRRRPAGLIGAAPQCSIWWDASQLLTAQSP